MLLEKEQKVGPVFVTQGHAIAHGQIDEEENHGKGHELREGKEEVVADLVAAVVLRIIRPSVFIRVGEAFESRIEANDHIGHQVGNENVQVNAHQLLTGEEFFLFRRLYQVLKPLQGEDEC